MKNPIITPAKGQGIIIPRAYFVNAWVMLNGRSELLTKEQQAETMEFWKAKYEQMMRNIEYKKNLQEKAEKARQEIYKSWGVET